MEKYPCVVFPLIAIPDTCCKKVTVGTTSTNPEKWKQLTGVYEANLSQTTVDGLWNFYGVVCLSSTKFISF